MFYPLPQEPSPGKTELFRAGGKDTLGFSAGAAGKIKGIFFCCGG